MKRLKAPRLQLHHIVALFMLLIVGIMPVAAQTEPCVPPPCPMDAPCPTAPPGGCVIVEPIQPGVFTNPEWLKIDYHRVNVSIQNQIATTSVSMEFRNEGNGLAEGTFMFPLPGGASVDQLTMTINGVEIEAKILAADEARSIYNEIVRQYRDPALLEYVGDSAIQANVFPIPPGESRKIDIRYSQVLSVDNGLLHYVYPLKITNLLSQNPVQEMSVRVEVDSNDPISNVYSPSHPIAIGRQGANKFTAGYESAGTIPADDFSLYYGLDTQNINANLLTYRESANEDGFFMLLVQPPLSLASDEAIAKDVIIVLDQSGSMFGDKWDQARDAAEYVLKQLNPADRFNVVLFSTGMRVFSNNMESTDQAQAAIDWVRGQEAIGGTDINLALTSAFDMADAERPTTVLFMTDGLATEGETDTADILENLNNAARPNIRVFSFGVGDDVDTFLLDSIVRDQHGVGTYVRPTERIDEEVASLYNKISAPVLTNVTLETGGLNTADVYPTTPLPDLFAGTQLTLVGRYRGDASNVSFTLKGQVNGEEKTFVYSGLNFAPQAGGETFIARLWATRRIGDLLNSIRLNGENKELVDSVVALSVRYGIITPYTSFLITEDDILSQAGRDRAEAAFEQEAQTLSSQTTGAGAVSAADASADLANAAAAPAQNMIMATALPTGTMSPNTIGGSPNEGYVAEPIVNPIQSVGGKTFLLQGAVWTDTAYEPDTMQTQKVVFLSDEYFALLDTHPTLAPFFAVGDQVIVVMDGVAYEVVAQ